MSGTKGIPSDIDYRKISLALDFYESRGYQRVKVPWVVSPKAEMITGRDFPAVASDLGYHVASAEQSFLQMILDGRLPVGKFVACTPCYRDEQETEYSEKWFLKVELINYLGFDRTKNPEKSVKEILADAKNFLRKYLPAKAEKTDIGFDLVSPDGIELGSYGWRRYGGFSWVYGTGLAEPRFSQCLAKRGRGYHLRDIPKGQLGSADKIFEEIEEFRDALAQGNPLMGALELSDLLGAVENYLSRRFGEAFDLRDLLKMKETTRRAFLSGQRK